MTYTLQLPEFLLIAIWDRSSQLAAMEDPTWDQRDRVERAKAGWVSYRPRDLTQTELTKAHRKAFLAALVKYEEEGLLEVYRDRTNRPTWTRLTPAGVEAANAILEREGVTVPPSPPEEEAAEPEQIPGDTLSHVLREVEALTGAAAEYDERIEALEAETRELRDLVTQAKAKEPQT